MANMPMPGADDDAYCANLVSERDRDRYLANLFAPAEKRRHLNALHAFAADLAAIKNRASEPLVGQFRLQWWRDTLAEIVAGTTIGVPIADALTRATVTAGLPITSLEAMIDAREAELSGNHLAGLAGFEDYLAATDGAIVELGVRILTGHVAPDGVSRAAGIALGLTGTMARLSSPSGAVDALPRDLQAIHGLQPDVSPKSVSPALRAVLADLIATARHHLARARAGAGALPREALPALLPLSTAELDLKRIGRAPFTGASGALRRQLAIYLASRRGRV